MTNPPLWKAFVVLAKADASNVAAAFELALPRPQAVLIAEDPFRDEATVEALYGLMPDGDLLTRLAEREVRVALLPDQDWIRLSQEGLPPVRAGRFFVFGAHDQGRVPAGVIPVRVEAGMAFGTGHHETTALCLLAMSDLGKRQRFRNVLDLGCGTGVLAIAAAKLFRCKVVASDIDPTATAVARANIRENGVEPRVGVTTADGLGNPMLSCRAPYDLIVANILASPLTMLAPQISRALERRGIAVLSGLLASQEMLVLSFYGVQGLVLRRRLRDGPWSALVLERVAGAR
jgi:ribosomal protein L11 methyltransferase